MYFHTKKSQFLCFSVCAEPQNRTFYVQQISRMRIFAGVFKYDICIRKQEGKAVKKKKIIKKLLYSFSPRKVYSNLILCLTDNHTIIHHIISDEIVKSLSFCITPNTFYSLQDMFKPAFISNSFSHTLRFYLVLQTL